jgi:chemotaxis signal transduction protein
VNANERRVETASGASAGTAARLRRLFDQSFAAPVSSQPERHEDLLAIRVGAERYGLRLAEIAGLHVDLRIVSVPSPAAQLLGIVGIRGTMAPIYDLAALLGLPPAPGSRWIVLARGPQTVGFAFGTFDAHLKVSSASLTEGNSQSVVTGQHLHGAVHVAGTLLPIIHLASILLTLKGSKT